MNGTADDKAAMIENAPLARLEEKRGCGFHRNPLDFLVGHVGFEPTTS